ncbi:hypothetical protein EYF80_035464 [Liparis tanakae]|uniref:Uncharacterized protein n=1 Tax=Liparis tanakae TaxID=230148 RepID=A0A4Z2GNJ0_9TELE|nr:hypothetical protein EYF80_035464 [Liparis tanakae]
MISTVNIERRFMIHPPPSSSTSSSDSSLSARPLPLHTDPASTLPRPDHQGGVGPAHRQQGAVVLGPAHVCHLSAVAHVALESSVLTLEEQNHHTDEEENHHTDEQNHHTEEENHHTDEEENHHTDEQNHHTDEQNHHTDEQNHHTSSISCVYLL